MVLLVNSKCSLLVDSKYDLIVVYYEYTYINISGNIVNNNDDFNERTNTLLYKNISHTLFSKGLMLVMCER